MNRERFLRDQARELDRIFSLTNGEEEARNRFERLAFDTYKALTSVGVTHGWFSVRPKSAGNLLNQIWRKEVSESLLHRWEEWSKEYDQVRARNPRLELRDMMQHISESHMCAGWPVDYEDIIQDWVDAGDPTASPFFVTPETGTPEFYHRLRELRQLCGGWLYWDGDSESIDIVFAPEPEWQRIRAARNKRRDEIRRRAQSSIS